MSAKELAAIAQVSVTMIYKYAQHRTFPKRLDGNGEWCFPAAKAVAEIERRRALNRARLEYGLGGCTLDEAADILE